MGLGTYLVGVGFALATWGPALFVGVTVVRRRLRGYTGATAVLAGALLALLALIGAHLVPGALGILSRESVAVTALLGAAAVFFLVPPAARPGGSAAPDPAAGNTAPSVALAALAVAIVGVVTVAAFLRLATDAPTHVDALSFGLPGVAEWIRTGSLFDAGAFFPLFQVRTYPNTGDVLYLATILPFGNDAFLRFATLPLLAVTGIAVYALARELRAPAATAALLGAAVIAVPSVTQPALDNIKPDVFMYATFAAGLTFLVRHARTGLRVDLLLAGAGIGLAFGSRWYGISSAVVVVGIWILAALAARRPLGRVAREGALLSATILAVGGFWFVRNAVLTGNPLYPVKFTPFGLDAPPDPITENLGFSIADRLGEAGLFTDHVLPGLRERLSLPALLLAAGALAALVMGLGRLRRRAPGLPLRPVALAVCALVLAGVYAITPASAQGFPGAPLPGIVGETARWAVPALLAAAGATAWALAEAGRWRLLGEAGLLVAAAVGIGAAYDDRPGDILAVAVVLAAICAAAVLVRRSRRLRQGLRRGPALALAGVAVVVVRGRRAARPAPLQRQALRGRQPGLRLDPGERPQRPCSGVRRRLAGGLRADLPRLRARLRKLGPLRGSRRGGPGARVPRLRGVPEGVAARRLRPARGGAGGPAEPRAAGRVAHRARRSARGPLGQGRGVHRGDSATASSSCSAAGHSGKDRDLVAVLHERLEAVEEADVLPADVDVHEAAQVPVLGDAVAQSVVAVVETVEHVPHGAGLRPPWSRRRHRSRSCSCVGILTSTLMGAAVYPATAARPRASPNEAVVGSISWVSKLPRTASSVLRPSPVITTTTRSSAPMSPRSASLASTAVVTPPAVSVKIPVVCASRRMPSRISSSVTESMPPPVRRARSRA